MHQKKCQDCIHRSINNASKQLWYEHYIVYNTHKFDSQTRNLTNSLKIESNSKHWSNSLSYFVLHCHQINQVFSDINETAQKLFSLCVKWSDSMTPYCETIVRKTKVALLFTLFYSLV